MEQSIPDSSQWVASAPNANSHGPVPNVTMWGNTFEGCDTGVLIGEDTWVVSGGNLFTDTRVAFDNSGRLDSTDDLFL